MILPKEINKVATINKINNQQIEKDYIVSWVLYGISENKTLFESLVFKGGTVLKKAYFPDYRFSEDLDFTLNDESIKNEQIKEEFKKVFVFVKEEANIDLQLPDNKWAVYASGSPQLYINYAGPLRGNMGSRDLKIDITRGEVLETAVERRSIFRNYSDLENEFFLKCYSLDEVLIEKMTALMGRMEPRDLYDFWFLTEIEGLFVDILSFKNKASRKGHNPNQFVEKVLIKEKSFKRDWINKLASQIHDLPDFETVFREVKRHIKF